jgi:hypothetical protein
MIATPYIALANKLMADIRAESNASADRIIASSGQDDFDGALVGELAKHEDVQRALLPSDDSCLAKILADSIETALWKQSRRAAFHLREHRQGAPQGNLCEDVSPS